MKRKYERPILLMQEFTPNDAVSTCATNGGIRVEMDCMTDRQSHILTVISSSVSPGSSCENQIGYAPDYDTARDYSHSSRHSDVYGGLWTEGDGYSQVLYPDAGGLMYGDYDRGQISGTQWESADGYIFHVKSGGSHHVVAPLSEEQLQSISIS